jgi:hypothetical protein
MKILLKSIGLISFLLVSAGYFLWIYGEYGFNFKPYTLFTWGFCIAAYLFCVYTLSLMFDLVE